MHGKTDLIHHQGGSLLRDLENPFQATRYHSLVIQPDSLPDEFEVSAWSEEPDGYREIMGITHKKYPLFGLQFHPESFLTHCGIELLKRFLEVSHPLRSNFADAVLHRRIKERTWPSK